MRLRGLDLNHLVTLETLLTECNLTRAAERHQLTQPAISNALTKLRDYFEDQLLVRNGLHIDLDAASRWVVSKPSFITDLTIAPGAQVSAAKGYRVQVTVDGVGTRLKPGHYHGHITLTPVAI